jgi:hypothetical protein
MSQQDIAEAWRRVVACHPELPALDVQHLRVLPETIDTPQRAWKQLKALPLGEGWLQFQSIVTCFAGGKLPNAEEDWGCLLAAEAVTTDGQSILVRQNGTGGLLLVRMMPGAGEGAEELLADKVSQLATGKVGALLGEKSPRLWYRRYWRQDKASGFRPVLAAFIGFHRPA